MLIVFCSSYAQQDSLNSESSFVPTADPLPEIDVRPISTHRIYLNERIDATKSNQSSTGLSPAWEFKEDTRPRFESISPYKEETIYKTNADGTKTAKYGNYIAGADNQVINRSKIEIDAFAPFLFFLIICYAVYKFTKDIKGVKSEVRAEKTTSQTSNSDLFHLNMTTLYELLVKSAMSECETEFLAPLAIQNAIISGKKVAEEDSIKLAKEFNLTINEVMVIINKTAQEIYNKYLEPNPNFEKIFNV